MVLKPANILCCIMTPVRIVVRQGLRPACSWPVLAARPHCYPDAQTSLRTSEEPLDNPLPPMLQLQPVPSTFSPTHPRHGPLVGQSLPSASRMWVECSRCAARQVMGWTAPFSSQMTAAPAFTLSALYCGNPPLHQRSASCSLSRRRAIRIRQTVPFALTGKSRK